MNANDNAAFIERLWVSNLRPPLSVALMLAGAGSALAREGIVTSIIGMIVAITGALLYASHIAEKTAALIRSEK